MKIEGKINIEARRYLLVNKKDNYMVDVLEGYGTKEFYLRHQEYGASLFMFSTPSKHRSTEEQLVLQAWDYIEEYWDMVAAMEDE